jgi:methylthioribose-1-phosphate isomerase
MKLPRLTRYAEQLRYDRDRGVVAVANWRDDPGVREPAEYTTAEECAQAIGAGAVGGPAAAYLAGYGMALAARAWAGRPAETQRAAVIQAAEWLRRARPDDHRLARLIDAGLERADAAVLSGGDAERALLEFVDGEILRADRVAERCGRIAAGLLDDGDRLLAHGFPGPALSWMLAVGAEDRQIELGVTVPPDDPGSAQLAVALATEIGVAATLVGEVATAAERHSLVLIGADRIALDGSVAGAGGAAASAASARQQGLPCYVLGYDGPDPACPNGAELIAGMPGGADANGAIVAPELISAIITSRGIYRPEMIARYLGDGDAPLDVIPLG